MTKLFNDPAEFVQDAIEGFLDAHSELVIGVPGGVVRAQEPPKPKVAVIVGGGSGHYPAFAGVVGVGFADGAVVGNVFTSPSAEDAFNVAKAANSGAGVIITSGNYAGDVMHFTAASERLRELGIESDVLFVTDDIASAPSAEIEKRRGIAGDFVVFKILGAAAESGASFNEVLRLGRKANDLTRSLGVAFAGCTLPGAADSLFNVDPDRMAVGLGIHGEPGISESPLPTAAELGQLLVEGVLAELPSQENKKIGAILNGLGSTKYEELFIVWATISRLLSEAGYTVIEPEVGELVTSLDMAGCSLTLVALDEELETLWKAPALTPAYKKGFFHQQSSNRRVIEEHADRQERFEKASPQSHACAERIYRGFVAVKSTLVQSEVDLGHLDSFAGDGDHGRGMVKGITAAVDAGSDALAHRSGAGSLLKEMGKAWTNKAGGTSGALWGSALQAAGDALGDSATEVTPEDLIRAVRAGQNAMTALGKAQLGDKTMLDAYEPFAHSFETGIAEGQSAPDAWAHAARVSEFAAKETESMTPKVGRARPLAEQSVGHPDPGAVSFAMCAQALTIAWSDNV